MLSLKVVKEDTRKEIVQKSELIRAMKKNRLGSHVQEIKSGLNNQHSLHLGERVLRDFVQRDIRYAMN